MSDRVNGMSKKSSMMMAKEISSMKALETLDQHEAPRPRASENQSFNVTAVIKYLQASHANYYFNIDRQALKFEFKDNEDEMTVIVTNKENFWEDIDSVILLFLTFGSNWDDVKANSSKKQATIINWFIKKFNICISSWDRYTYKSITPPEIITLPKIAACFPATVCRYYEKGLFKPIFTFADMKLNEKDNVSKAILTTYFTSMIPISASYKIYGIHYFFFLAHVLTDNISHPQVTERTTLTCMLSNYRFALESPAVSENDRIAYCKKIGVLTEFGYFKAFFRHNHKYRQEIEHLRQGEPDLKYVIDELFKLNVQFPF